MHFFESSVRGLIILSSMGSRKAKWLARLTLAAGSYSPKIKLPTVSYQIGEILESSASKNEQA